MTIIVMDTETTGLLQPLAAGTEHQPHLVEFYGIKLNYELEVIDTLSFRCKPPIPIPDDAIKIHGITNEMIKDCESFAPKFNDLADFFCGSNLLVGHNIKFDQYIIYWELVRLGMTINFPWSRRNICTAETSSKQLGYRQNLSDLHLRLFGTDFSGSHSASSDCEATMKCFVELVKKGVVELCFKSH